MYSVSGEFDKQAPTSIMVKSLCSCQLYLAVVRLFKGGGYEQHVSATAQREKGWVEKQQPDNTEERQYKAHCLSTD